ncbi:alpha/beta hydrolase [Alphaproteobacteria bacterium KMM 3653]|uniref:Alpha/beta hydrolase n=1 Tax=Harenicola maris TaxID=2841044 RepID=A0AAP2G4C0_9RHOB|nr:alpha/beta hydrolase [Harenicola maris]
MPYGQRAGIGTKWSVWGEGPERAVMVHCSLARHEVLRPLYAALDAPALQAVAFDMPGHGGSDPWEGAREYQGATAQVGLSFCEGPAHVIGHSFGATVALRMAVEAPERVASLTLIEPVFFAVARVDGAAEYAAHAADFAPFVDAMAAGEAEAAARIFTGLWGGGTPWDQMPPALRADIAGRIGLIPAGADAIEEDCAGLLTSGVLEALDLPVLLVAGAQTQSVVHAIHRGLAARIKGAQSVVIEGAGHMVPLSHPVQVAAAIRASGVLGAAYQGIGLPAQS